MKRNYLYLLASLAAALILLSFSGTSKFKNPNKDKLILQVMTYVLERGHYDPVNIDDAFSENLFNEYLNSADPLKGFLMQEDVDKLSKHKDLLDDQIKNISVDFFNDFYPIIIERIKTADALQAEVLQKPFDFNKKEDFSTDYENKPFAANTTELKERWRKQLKFTALPIYKDLMDEREKKLKGGEEAKSPTEIEAEARENVAKNMKDYFTSINERRREEWFYSYLSLISQAYDPHTEYLSPQEKEVFDVDMSGKYYGIGARLQKRDGDVNVVELISGGPAWRYQELEVGDKIMKVAQGNEEPVNITAMRLDDAIKLIKGPEGTEVRLTVKKIDGSQQVISIVREEIELEETYAKTTLIQQDDATFGLINLPKFYIDFDNPDARNAAEDVKKELQRLNEAGAEGVIIDLRNNGGGSLQTVVEMGGLFIDKGPIVQVKSAGGKQRILEDRTSGTVWDKPLVILVNELSASASEILAAAMQDYKRAVIIGSKQTYGKGTVQQIYGLSDILNDSSVGDIGAIKITVQKFYRVNGGSTQLEGVKSDVVVPDRYRYIEIGEKDTPNPLEWDKVAPAKYTPWDQYKNLDLIAKNSQSRINQRPEVQLLDAQAQWIKTQRDDNTFPLNYNDYILEIKQNEEAIKKFDTLNKFTYNLTFSSLPYELQLFQKDTILQAKRLRWHKDLTKDVVVDEAVQVLKDLQKDAQQNALAAVKN